MAVIAKILQSTEASNAKKCVEKEYLTRYSYGKIYIW